MRSIDERLDELFAEMVRWRRTLHRHPELSYREEGTAAFVAERLRQWGLEVATNVGGHGVVGRLRGGLPGPTVALRADMDALPIQDQKTCEYRSQVEGVMHACGHDGHTATLLGVAKAFGERKAELAGTLVFLFQPAEEVAPGGAQAMIRDGALQGVDVIYGVHLWTPFEVGEARSLAGPMMASVDDFVIEIRGKGGHGGLPHDTVDSIVVGSHLVVNLQSIVSRNIDPTEPCVITVGSFQAGSSFNVIAEKTVLKGTVRTFSDRVRKLARSRLEQVVGQTCAMFGAEAAVDYKPGYPAVVNDERETERFFQVAPSVVGEEFVQLAPRIMAAEDFAYYLRELPGCFMFVGAGNREAGIVSPHHHPRFDIDEQAMRHASKLLANMALHYMSGQ